MMSLAPPPQGTNDIISKAVLRAFAVAELENSDRMVGRIEIADLLIEVRYTIFFDSEDMESGAEYNITVRSDCWAAFVRCGSSTRRVFGVLFCGDYRKFERHAVLLSLA